MPILIIYYKIYPKIQISKSHKNSQKLIMKNNKIIFKPISNHNNQKIYQYLEIKYKYYLKKIQTRLRQFLLTNNLIILFYLHNNKKMKKFNFRITIVLKAISCSYKIKKN